MKRKDLRAVLDVQPSNEEALAELRILVPPVASCSSRMEGIGTVVENRKVKISHSYPSWERYVVRVQ